MSALTTLQFNKLHLHHAKIKTINAMILFSQVLALGLLAFICNRIALAFNLPIPGSVLGMGILFLLLIFEWVPEHMLRVGAAWLIGDLLLFFIPPVISVIKYEGLLEHYGLKLILTLVLGTAIVMVSTGFVVDRLFKIEQKRNDKHALKNERNKQ